jgi:hypothetical protein
LVQIHRGDFHEIAFQKKFSLISCDATHDIKEIAKNFPRIMNLVDNAGIVICDDFCRKDMQDYVLRNYSFKWRYFDRGLFYAMTSD